MSTPPIPVPRPQALQERREELHQRHQTALARVGELSNTHQEMGQAIKGELLSLSGYEQRLKRLDASHESLFGVLMRRFSSRNEALERRSVSEGLMLQYQEASLRLRQASAFSDELQLMALELQEELKGLHQQRKQALAGSRDTAQRVLELERALSQVEGRLEQGEDLEERADELSFQLRTQTLNLELFRAAEGLAQDNLEPCRALRDTVMELHEGMAGYVLNASVAVDSAGRRIQALGMAADAPTVVGELQESLASLGQAMQVTQAYVEQTQVMLTEVLPDLAAKVRLETEGRQLLLTEQLEEVSRERSRALADLALREAAVAEVEGLGEL